MSAGFGVVETGVARGLRELARPRGRNPGIHQRRVTSIEHGGRTVEVVEATADDVALAQRLATHLGAGLDDLPPQTRRVLGLVDDFVQARAGQLELHRDRVRFSRRELRRARSRPDAGPRMAQARRR